MKAKEIQELIDFIAKSGLEEVNIETDSFKISVKRTSPAIVGEQMIMANPVSVPAAVVGTPVNNNTTVTETKKTVEETPSSGTVASEKISQGDESKYIAIKSPMIGTFYRSSNPDTPAFASVGDEVKVGKVVCIIEAMKLFNEIESEVSGRIVKVLVDNASPVEYDPPLFLVDPS